MDYEVSPAIQMGYVVGTSRFVLHSVLYRILANVTITTALERATQTSLLRFHLQNSRTEQESYLQSVEKARVKSAMDTKAESRRESKRAKGEEEGGEEKVVKKVRERTYRQREVVKGGAEKVESRAGSKKELDGVLSRLF